jgi:hypothetical protein
MLAISLQSQPFIADSVADIEAAHATNTMSIGRANKTGKAKSLSYLGDRMRS